MTKLRLARNLHIPPDAVTQRFAFLARTGGGKTYAAGVLVEELDGIGAQFVVLDPVGNWWGLRLNKSGKGQGLQVPVLGGQHGDLQLEPTGGRLVAESIVNTGSSAVIDVSMFRKNGMRQFVTDFMERLFELKKTNRGPIHVVMEEAQMFCPERGGASTARMVGAAEDLVRLGRNFGIGVTLISQRPQAIAKACLNQTEVLVCLQMTGTHERKAISKWIEAHGIEGAATEADQEIPGLQQGEAFVWSPAWLKTFVRVKFRLKRTYDASSTPTFGDGDSVAVARPLPADALKALSEAMAATVERAEATDPKKLQAKVDALERQLAARPAAKVERIEVVVPDAEACKAMLARFSEIRADIIRGFALMGGQVDAINDQIASAVRDLGSMLEPVKVYRGGGSRRRGEPAHAAPGRRRGSPTPNDTPVTEDGPLTPTEGKILNALSWMAGANLGTDSVRQVALFAGVSPRSSGVPDALRRLRRRGYLSAGSLDLTAAGLSAATPTAAATTTDEIVAHLRQRLNPSAGALLAALVSTPGESWTREQLCDETGLSVRSSGVSEALRTLKSLGVIQAGRGGPYRATDIMFPGVAHG